MDRERLYAAARTNNVTTLDEILQTNPQILFSASIEPSDNPLHVAALFGHRDFARAIMDQYPGLSRERNDKGYYPIHLASSKGHSEFVSELLKYNTYNEQCFLADREGRTALQLAAIKGQEEVVRVLLTQCPESAKVVSTNKETVLHLVVKYNVCEIMEMLLSLLSDCCLLDEIVNCKDEDGNTVLHLAAARKQPQMLKILSRNTNVNMNEVNGSGLTALEASAMDFKERLESNDKSSDNDKSGDKAGEKNGASDIKMLLGGILVLNSLFATISFEALLNLSDATQENTIPAAPAPAPAAPAPAAPAPAPAPAGHYPVGADCFFSSLVTILFALVFSGWKKFWVEFYITVPVLTVYTVVAAGFLFADVYTLKTKEPFDLHFIDSDLYIMPAILLGLILSRLLVWCYRKLH